MIMDLVDDGFAAWVDRKMEGHLPYPPEATALLLVDVQRDFFDTLADGWIEEVATSVGWTENLRALVAGCRDAGVTVVHCPFRLPTTGSSIPYVADLEDRGLLDPEREGSELPDELVADGDVVLPSRTTLNVFYGTDLEEELRDREITHLLVAGAVANAGVDSTGRMGVELGYDVTFVSDCVAAVDPESYSASVEVTFRRMAHRVWPHSDVLSRLGADGG